MKEKTKLEAALDELLSGKSTEEIVGPEGLLKQLTKAVLERAMGEQLPQSVGNRFWTIRHLVTESGLLL